jgi:hypothetical protein
MLHHKLALQQLISSLVRETSSADDKAAGKTAQIAEVAITLVLS